MAEYIEREAALRVLCDACGNAACPKGLIPRCSYYEKMHSIPAADVRPVEWIPVEERLPEAGERVLCYCRANIYEVMKMRTDGDWVYDTNHIYMHSFVTHWMPLPQPPKEE